MLKKKRKPLTMHEKRILKTQPAGEKGKSGITDLTEGIIWKQLIIFAILFEFPLGT